MLHEYHAQMMSRDRERRLRAVSELARLHHEATAPATRRPRWARRRRPAPDALTPGDLRPAYRLRTSSQ
jgi:hypothetical protein